MAKKPKPPLLDLGVDWEIQLYEIIEDAGVAQMILEINRDKDEDYQREDSDASNFNTVEGLLQNWIGTGTHEWDDAALPWDENIPRGELLLVKGSQGFAVVYVNPVDYMEAAFLGWDSIVNERLRRKKRRTTWKDGKRTIVHEEPTPEQWPLWSGWKRGQFGEETYGVKDLVEVDGFTYKVIPRISYNSPKLGVLNWWW